MLPSVRIHSFRIAYSYPQDCDFAVAFALHPCSLQTVRRIFLVFHMNPSHFHNNSALNCGDIVLYSIVLYRQHAYVQSDMYIVW